MDTPLGKTSGNYPSEELYGPARYHARTESVTRMHGMKVPASIEAASRFMGPTRSGLPAPVVSRFTMI